MASQAGVGNFKSNLGAGYNAFNVPKYGQGSGLGGGIGGGIGSASIGGLGGIGGLSGGGFGRSSNVDLNANTNTGGGLGGLGSS